MAFVTTVIPTYNAERFLTATLESIGQQVRPPDRLVLLDNCSTDRTPELFEAFRHKYPGINSEYHRNEKNIGVLANFNRAVDFASETDILHIHSADDLIKPEFLSKLVPVLEGKTGRALVHSQLEFIDDQGKPMPPPPISRPGPPEVLSQFEFLKRQSELRHVYCQSVLLGTNRQPSPVHFPYDWLQAADVVFFSEWATYCDFIAVVNEPPCQYRVHTMSTTGGNLRNVQAWVLEEWRAMRAVAALMKQTGLPAWLHEQKQKCLFAARSRVKMQQTEKLDPRFASEIRRVTREKVSPLHWALGNLAVYLRDTLRYLSGSK